MAFQVAKVTTSKSKVTKPRRRRRLAATPFSGMDLQVLRIIPGMDAICRNLFRRLKKKIKIVLGHTAFAQRENSDRS